MDKAGSAWVRCGSVWGEAPVTAGTAERVHWLLTWTQGAAQGRESFSPPGAAQGSKKTGLAKMLKVVHDVLPRLLSHSNPFCDVVPLKWFCSAPELCPLSWGVSSTLGTAWVLRWVSLKRARVVVTRRIPGSQSNVAHFCMFSSTSLLMHAPPFLALCHLAQLEFFYLTSLKLGREDTALCIFLTKMEWDFYSRVRPLHAAKENKGRQMSTSPLKLDAMKGAEEKE